mgnify:CR=1 FL=1
MGSERKNLGQVPESAFQKMEKMHPHLMLTWLIIAGVFLIFGFLTLAFIHSAVTANPATPWYNLPKAFSVSTVAILLSSFSLHKSKLLFDQENFKALSSYLVVTMLLGLVFFISQAIGWVELNSNGAFFSGTGNMNSYLFLLSALHLLHLLGGFIFLGVVAWRIFKASMDPVQALVTVTNPYEKLRFKMMGLYWHAMDALWLLIFFSLLFFI